ncbi:MAG: CHAT domain-containing protein [Cyclobacteriaceae bacterium]|nr:CHAT domain-containing protein [Cyclobacteriaceae bacterium]MCH8516304.1 CHAT domain-containing protein [Cyclobacteriaceae bacterium]
MHTLLPKIWFLSITLFLLSSTSSIGQDTSVLKKAASLYELEEFEELVKMEEQLSPYFHLNDSTGLMANMYLGAAFTSLGKYEEALKYYQQELEIFKEVHSKDHSEYAGLLNNMAYAHLDAMNYGQAVKFFEMAIPLQEKKENVNPDILIGAKLELANLYTLTNQYDKAESSFGDLVAEVTNDSPYFIPVLSYKSEFHLSLGQFSRAEENALKALQAAKEQDGELGIRYLAALANLAKVYLPKGRFPDAEEIYLKIARLMEDQGMEESLEYHAIQNNLGSTYTNLARYDEAIQTLSSTLEYLESLESYQTLPIYQLTVSNLSAALILDQQFDAGIKQLNDLLAQLPENSLEYAYDLNNISMAYLRLGEIDKAHESYQRALDIFKELKGENSLDYALAKHNLGRVYYHQNDPRALTYFVDALKIREKGLGTHHPRYGESMERISSKQWALGNSVEARKAFDATFNNYFEQINTFFPTMSEHEKAKFYNNKIKITFEIFNSFAVNQLREAPEITADMYDFQLNTKAIIMYASSKVRESIMNSGDEELIQQYQNWLATKEKLARALALREEEREELGIDVSALMQTSNELEKELNRKSSAFAGTYSAKQKTWRDVQSKLKAGEAAIEIIRFRQYDPKSGGSFSGNVSYAALIVKKDTQDYPEIVHLSNGEDLEGKFLKNYRNGIRFKVDEDFSYDTYWKPIAEKLQGIERVYFSPDGVYNQISLNTLRNPQTNDYLLNEVDLNLVTNTKDLLASTSNQPQNQTGGKAYLFGFPNYDLGADQLSDADQQAFAADIASTVRSRGMDRSLRGSLQRHLRGNELMVMLPGTKEEVEKIAALYGQQGNQYEKILHNDAVEEAVKEVKRPHTLHIATHGFFMENDEVDLDDRENQVQNPLFRAGLIMAGANNLLQMDASQVQQDGVLTAYEAMNMDLEGTELVVLSACETGLGQISNGEGVYGLQRAFLVAGAKSLIMSLWAVDDAATQKLMTGFYENWLSSGSKSEAFRKAQMELKEEYPEPFYWGAFVLVGDPN